MVELECWVQLSLKDLEALEVQRRQVKWAVINGAMVLESGAPQYALQEVADPPRDCHLLADPQLGPGVRGEEYHT